MTEVTIPIKPPLAGEPAEIQQRFTELAETWRSEVAFLSSMTQMVEHPAYQEIVKLGPSVIPLLLRELEQDPDWWFAALQALTGDDPVLPEQRGSLDAMANAWIKWGKEQGYTCYYPLRPVTAMPWM